MRGSGVIYREVGGDEWVGWHAPYEKVAEGNFCYWDDPERDRMPRTLKRIVEARGQHRVGTPPWR